MTSRNESAVGSACPCCQFLNENWFLPNPDKEPLLFSRRGVDLGERVDHRSEDDDAMLTPCLAWQRLYCTSATAAEDEATKDSPTNPRIVLFDTHSHAHLEQEQKSTSSARSTYSLSVYLENSAGTDEMIRRNVEAVVPLISCSVQPSDWNSCLEYASQSKVRIPALGVHPWYIESILSKENLWYEELEMLIQQHQGCMVGEIGLCKMARFVRTYEGGKAAALALQRDIFLRQLLLAAKYQRPVSVHCVNQHGVLLEILQGLDTTTQTPSTIALHSYTGTEYHVKNLLQWESSILCPPGSSTTVERPPLLYFGVSHSVNCAMCTSVKSQRQGRDTLRAIPRDRLLLESDVHCSDDVILGTAGAAAYVSAVWQIPLEEVAAITTANALRFIQPLSAMIESCVKF
jgi:Tat protein secretion system quality control protein TatD with DNase activity